MGTSTKRIVVKCPTCDQPYNYDIPEKLPQRPRVWCNNCKKQFGILGQIRTSTARTKGTGDVKKNKIIPPQITDSTSPSQPEYIDDPDELLLSTAIRELNKPNPDPRWANILISCKKENISTKTEVFEQFKQLPTQALVNLLRKNSQEEPI